MRNVQQQIAAMQQQAQAAVAPDAETVRQVMVSFLVDQAYPCLLVANTRPNFQIIVIVS
jgi:hypothetical protein